MNNALSAQPECGLSEIPPAGAAALAAFLSAPPQALPPAQLKPAFLLPVRPMWRQVLNNVADFLACSHEDKVFLFAQIENLGFLSAVLAIAKGYQLVPAQSLAMIEPPIP
ncbi:hypothetical protein WAE56_12675 [Iodobacter sp. LRB]|uniref:hypothetical protein n=1 Tax=unclassified Iodobacter TaxID=235634 RepID=UPI000C0EC53F|nr:hypothetical protein [Iodobacter sp. BJB302]PHV00914.1 hypothetical protein CSQ88_14935 [Iodobacter sp. BJB302]